MTSTVIGPGIVRVLATEAELQAMEQNDMGLWWTPGAQEPYWASRPRFAQDVAVAAPRDFLAAAGYEVWSELEDGDEGELLSLVVTRPGSGFLTTREAADALGITERTVRKWAPRWPGAQKIGRDWLIPADRLDWWRQQCHRPGPRSEAGE